MLTERIYLSDDKRAWLDTYVSEFKPYRRDAMLVIPGGGYRSVCSDREGEMVALGYFAKGYNAFVLNYRVAEEGDVYPRQLLDACRAVLHIKANAEKYNINADRVFAVRIGSQLTFVDRARIMTAQDFIIITRISLCVIVTCFRRCDDTVTANSFTCRSAGIEEAVECQSEVGTRILSFRLEHMDIIDAALINFIGRITFLSVGAGLTFKFVCHFLSAVHTAQVDKELAVNIDPYIVITGECEGFATFVLEEGMDFGRKVAIDLTALVSNRTHVFIADAVDG